MPFSLPSPKSNVSSITQPIQESLVATIQRLLTLDNNDREKLQIILAALNSYNEPPQVIMPPVTLPNFNASRVAIPPILTPTSSCDTPIETKLNPEAPTFRDFSRLKSIISTKLEGTKEPSHAEGSDSKTVSPSPETASSPAKAVSTDFPHLKWKMSPKKTWGLSVHQRLADTRRKTRPDHRPAIRPALTIDIPVDNTASIPTAM